MSATSVTLRGRAAAERLMLDTCTIQRTASLTTDPDTGVVTPTYTTVYTGKCKVQQQSPASAPTVVGEASVFVGQLELNLPMSVTGVQPDDLPAHKSYLTARRYPVVEVAG
jgi:hypothetical protein